MRDNTQIVKDWSIGYVNRENRLQIVGLISNTIPDVQLQLDNIEEIRVLLDGIEADVREGRLV